jgi:hypothetical protein
LIHHLIATFASTVPVDQLDLKPWGPGLFCWGETELIAQLNALSYLCGSGVPLDAVRLHAIDSTGLVTVTQSIAAYCRPELILGLPDEVLVAALLRLPVPHHQIDQRLAARHTIHQRLEEGHKMLAVANGYRVHGPGDADDDELECKYWWTLHRDGWSGTEVSMSEFLSADDALKDAVRAHLEEAQGQHLQEA